MCLVGLALDMGLQGTESLVEEHKPGQVPGVGVRGLQDGAQLLPEAAQTQGATVSAGPAAPVASTHLACKTGPGKEPTGPRSFNPGPLPSMPLGLLPPWIQALTSRHLLEEVFPDYPATFFKRSSLTTPRIRMPTVFCSLIQLFFSFRAHITT